MLIKLAAAVGFIVSFLIDFIKISWIKKVTNGNVMTRAQAERQLMKQIVKRQCSFLGHVLRKRGIEYQVITGKVEGKRDRGRQRQTFLGWVGKFLDRRGVDIIRLAENKTLHHVVTANVRI